MAPPPSTGGAPRGSESDSLPIERVLELLKDPVRRQTVAYCATAADRAFDIDDVVDHLAIGRVPSRERITGENIAAELHHHHLPKLADAGVIEFDPRSGHFRYLGDDRLEKWVRRIQAEISD